ncbi:MAG: transglutaminase family protein [Nitrospirota bacterium]
MPDIKNIPYLLKLLEDDSPSVQRSVFKELLRFGPHLENGLAALPTPPSSHQHQRLQKVFEELARYQLKEAWVSWLDEKEEMEKLEKALTLLAKFQDRKAKKLSFLLDELSNDYLKHYDKRDASLLAQYLFGPGRLEGAKEDYYDPKNSNLVYVIETKRGLPISLACIFMLTGKRLYLTIGGYNFPQHFFAWIVAGDQKVLVDCFNSGQLIEEKWFLDKVAHGLTLKNLHDMNADATMIVGRVLRNLVVAYDKTGQKENSALMKDLIKAI